MSQNESGSKQEIAPYQQIISTHNNGYAEIDIPAGTEIWTASRLAAKIAVIEGMNVRFLFNDTPNLVTIEQAKDMLTKEKIKDEIVRHRAKIESLKANIAKVEQQIEEEKQLGVLIHGEDFLDSLE